MNLGRFKPSLRYKWQRSNFDTAVHSSDFVCLKTLRFGSYSALQHPEFTCHWYSTLPESPDCGPCLFSQKPHNLQQVLDLSQNSASLNLFPGLGAVNPLQQGMFGSCSAIDTDVFPCRSLSWICSRSVVARGKHFFSLQKCKVDPNKTLNEQLLFHLISYVKFKMSWKCHDTEVIILKTSPHLSRVAVGLDNCINRRNCWYGCKLQRNPSGFVLSQSGSCRTC